MRLKAFAVIDTNVIVSSVISQNSYPSQILNFVDRGNIIPVFDKRMLNEYYKVLSYPKFHFNDRQIYDAMYGIINNGILINNVEQAKAEFSDRTDMPFFEVKESSEELDSYLVTGNKKHFPESPSTVTPKELLNIMERLDKWVAVDLITKKILRN